MIYRFIFCFLIFPLLISTQDYWLTDVEVLEKEAELELKVRNFESVEPTERISGGEGATITEYPYVANYGLVCGAVIISKNWLLTSAYCSDRYHNIYAGSTLISRAKNVSIAKHIIHPKFRKGNYQLMFDYDYQLLKLRKPLNFSRQIQPIRFGSEKDIVIGSYAEVIGWGSTHEKGPDLNHLRASKVPIVDQDVCRTKADGELAELLSKNNMLCAGLEKGGSDACEGDAGGPLVYNDALIAIVSFGEGCAEPNSPGVYAKITPEIKRWIAREIGVKIKHL